MRSAGSKTANIADGNSRGSGADRRRFLEYAPASRSSADAVPGSRLKVVAGARRRRPSPHHVSRITRAPRTALTTRIPDPDAGGSVRLSGGGCLVTLETAVGQHDDRHDHDRNADEADHEALVGGLGVASGERGSHWRMGEVGGGTGGLHATRTFVM